MVLDHLFSMKAERTWQHLQLQLVHELEHIVLSASGKMDQLGWCMLVMRKGMTLCSFLMWLRQAKTKADYHFSILIF